MQHSLPANLPLQAHGDRGQPGSARPSVGDHAHAHPPAAGAFDRIGAFLGFACAVHCIAVPLLFAVLPTLGLGFLADEAFDLTIVVIASLCALVGARTGWRAHHDVRVVLAFGLAIALLVSGHAVGEESAAGRLPSVIGGIVLAVTHLANLRLSKRACAHVQGERGTLAA